MEAQKIPVLIAKMQIICKGLPTTAQFILKLSLNTWSKSVYSDYF